MSEQFETYCCGQPMRSFGVVDFIGPTIESGRRWVCEVCGHGIDLVHFDFDEAELENELELYGDLPSPSHIQQLKGGGVKMADEFSNKDTATLCPTKAGNGYKVVVNRTWFYTSKASLLDMVNGKNKACTFSTIKDNETVSQ
jgi:hypothetical protein